MLHTKFQESEASGSEKEKFINIFYVFLCFKPGIQRRRAILDPETFISTNLLKNF